jgi:hypothetical protein
MKGIIVHSKMTYIPKNLLHDNLVNGSELYCRELTVVEIPPRTYCDVVDYWLDNERGYEAYYKQLEILSRPSQDW